MVSKTKSLFTRYAIYTLVFLLVIASFVPVGSHTICGGCPPDGSQDPLVSGRNGQCPYSGTNHNDHEVPPPPPPTQEDCDRAKEKCNKAQEETAAAREKAYLVCAAAAIEPSPAGEVACAIAMAHVAWQTARAIVICLAADDICSRVE